MTTWPDGDLFPLVDPDTNDYSDSEQNDQPTDSANLCFIPKYLLLFVLCAFVCVANNLMF